MSKKFFPFHFSGLFIGFISAVTLELAVVPIRMIGFELSSVTGFCLFCSITVILLSFVGREGREWWVLGGIILGLFALQAPTRIKDWSLTMISLPDGLAHLLGIAVGFAWYKGRVYIRWSALGLGLMIVGFIYWKGYHFWFNRIYYGTFTGCVNESLPTVIEGYDRNHVLQGGDQWKGKVVLLDFWFTGCGVCFEKFPKVQYLYDKYKGNPSFALFAIDKPVEVDTVGQAFAMLDRRGYSFPIILAFPSTLPQDLGIFGFPTTLILVNQTVVFRGDIDDAERVIDRLLLVAGSMH